MASSCPRSSARGARALGGHVPPTPALLLAVTQYRIQGFQWGGIHQANGTTRNHLTHYRIQGFQWEGIRQASGTTRNHLTHHGPGRYRRDASMTCDYSDSLEGRRGELPLLVMNARFDSSAY
ncbi:hypothetical protein VPH35_026682 [Triticum aestivum]